MDFPGRDATNDLKIRISQAMKIHYWLRLSKSFHERIFSHSWATKTSVCKQATSHFRRLHKLWAAKKHRHAQSLERKRQLKLKTLADTLFKGTKKSYEVSENEKFAENRLPAEQSRLLKVTFVPFNVSSNEKIQGDLVLEVPFLVEMITWIIKMIKRPEILNINAPNSQPICHNRVGEKQGLISITRGLNVTPGIMKGKQGNLIIVG
ncbi:unconventional myosin IC isoform X2 [Bemisia tabaci]|uniref:unconventional myosin IC isoform X2 n=1 Tax=Bemisia tabaci TaxID=7038 RepID=UPI003B27FCA3